MLWCFNSPGSELSPGVFYKTNHMDVLPNTSKATYPFAEAIDRIFQCDSLEELKILAAVLDDEKHEYALYYLNLMRHAIEMKVEFLMTPPKK